ncbi:MAG: hypothetical protein NVSMB51_01490 [Solirubrobacteraceae bacterium]
MRKLIFGETWQLPLGVFSAVAIAGLVRLLAGPDGWWRDFGGFLLLMMVIATLAAALRRSS